MEQQNKAKAMLPPPSFEKKPHEAGRSKPHYLTPSGMTLLPREKQPPPMYGGPRGATVPPTKLLYENGGQMNQNAPSNRPPERHFCEACEMEFQSGEDLRLHSSQHERCPINGCRFRGHTSVMDLHVVTLHPSGLSEEVKKLSTPEEIAAWREERRKKFPTLTNVQMRQRAQEQRKRRGELMGNRRPFGNPHECHRMQNGGAGDKTPPTECQEHNTAELPNNNNKRRERKSRQRKTFQKRQQTQESAKVQIQGEKVKPLEVGEEVENCAGVPMFRGTSAMKGYKHMKLKKKEPETNALDSLAGMYGSDDSTDDTEVESEEMEDESNNVLKKIAVEAKVIASDSRVNEMQNHKFSEAENSQTHVEQCTVTFSDKITDDCIGGDLSELQEVNDNSVCSDEVPPNEAPIERSSNLAPPTQDPGALKPAAQQFKPSARAQTNSRSSNVQKFKRKSGLDYRGSSRCQQNTMLAKLLEPEIRHERNVMMQCVRFVCENDFFGIGGNGATKSTTH